jgi:hypothetical protein
MNKLRAEIKGGILATIPIRICCQNIKRLKLAKIRVCFLLDYTGVKLGLSHSGKDTD